MCSCETERRICDTDVTCRLGRLLLYRTLMTHFWFPEAAVNFTEHDSNEPLLSAIMDDDVFRLEQIASQAVLVAVATLALPRVTFLRLSLCEFCIKANRQNVLTYALQLGANPNGPLFIFPERTLLYDAVRYWDADCAMQMIAILMTNGAWVDHTCVQPWPPYIHSPLHEAVQRRRSAHIVLQYLLRFGMPIHSGLLDVTPVLSDSPTAEGKSRISSPLARLLLPSAAQRKWRSSHRVYG